MNLPPPPAAPASPAVPPPPPAIPPPPETETGTEAESSEEFRPSRLPLVLGSLLVLVFFGGGAMIWAWANRPSPCAGANVSSDRFGYCIRAPAGWQLAESPTESSAADQLFRTDGDSTLMIQAVETGRDLRAFADDVRRLQTAASLETGTIRSLAVAGADALEWDATLRSESDPITTRTVVFERSGVAWRVEFSDAADVFDAHVGDLARMLSSWRFR